MMIWQQANRLWSLSRLTPFDTSTEEGRSSERYRRAWLTTLTSVAARGLWFLTLVVSVPLMVRYLGAERYGLWATITAAIALLTFADLGLGNGLLNAISEANGRNDTAAARKYVSSAFFMLTAVAFVGFLAFAVAYPLVPWPKVFNVTSAAAVREAGPATAVFFACFILNVPLGVVQRVQMGYQEGFTNYLWQAVGSLLALVGLLAGIGLHLGLPWLVLAMSGGPVVAMAINWRREFRWSRPWLFPRLRFLEWAATRRLARLGFLFLVLQVAIAVAYSSDNVIASRVLGPVAAARYAVAQRLFLLAPLAIGLALVPLWPAYGEAHARADHRWIRRTLWRSLTLSAVAAGVPALILVLFRQPIFAVWVGSSLIPSLGLAAGLAVWSVLYACGTAVSVLLNALNVIGFQAVTALVMAVASLALKVYLSQRVGLAGIIWGLVLAYAVFVAIPTTAYMIHRLRTSW
jgi:O-antigen/teichoic acid export membrane protein